MQDVVAILTGIGGLGAGGVTVALIQARANKNKTAAETDNERAQAKLATAEADSVAVAAVKEALKEVRQNSLEKDKRLNAQDQRMTQMQQDIKKLEDQGHRIQIALAAHGQWDILVVAQVRQIIPNFPDPPPLMQFDTEFHDNDSKEG